MLFTEGDPEQEPSNDFCYLGAIMRGHVGGCSIISGALDPARLYIL